MSKLHVTTTINGEPAEFLCTATQTVLEAMGVIVLRCDGPEDVMPTIRAACSMVWGSGEAVAVLLGQRLLGAKKF